MPDDPAARPEVGGASPLTPDDDPAPDADAALHAARVRALSSPLRWRILRLCLHTPRTNRELADLLARNPGSVLHHVRTLVATGFLQAQPAARGGVRHREIPYLATGLTWTMGRDAPELDSVLVDVLREEARQVDPGELSVWRLGLRLSDADRAALADRLTALYTEFRDRSADTEGAPWSLMTFLHPDAQQGPTR